MAKSPPRKMAHLRVRSDADSEIFLIGNDRQLLVRGVGGLEADVPEAIYKLKIKRGAALQESLLDLAGDQDIEARLGAGAVAASSLAASRDSRAPPQEYEALTELAADARSQLGGRGKIDFYIAGCLRLEDEQRRSSKSPLAGMRLYPWSEHGDAITLNAAPAQKTVGVRDAQGGGKKWAVSAFRGKPGIYVLEMQDGDRCLRQIVPILRQWQTWVLVRRAAVEGKLRSSVAVHAFMDDNLTHLGRRLEQGEVSRLALAAGNRIYTSKASIDTFLHAKFDNVLTGLSAAHLMIDAIERYAQEQRAKAPVTLPVEFTAQDVETVIGNLARLLSTTSTEAAPDIVGLKLRAGMALSQAERAITSPPMTWRSWSALQAAALGENPAITLDYDMFGECAWNHDANAYFVWSATRGKIGAFVKNVVETAGYAALPAHVLREFEAAQRVEEIFPTAMALGFGKSTLEEVADRAGIPRNMLSLPSVTAELTRFIKG
jgi:hypothetical protein